MNRKVAEEKKEGNSRTQKNCGNPREVAPFRRVFFRPRPQAASRRMGLFLFRISCGEKSLRENPLPKKKSLKIPAIPVEKRGQAGRLPSFSSNSRFQKSAEIREICGKNLFGKDFKKATGMSLLPLKIFLRVLCV
ncbi:hypothetical protein [Candidatus Spyradosoma sp. SGI.093]|uniref:hypothetical protein n=1 Tax=Candidatus Spyradosoma sp. SGI.093 TaxID=3420583 RepID=UPI003D051F79